MCRYCTMSHQTMTLIEDWADRGCPYSNKLVMSRPSAVSDPNTYVIFFENAVTINGSLKTIKLDVHYEGTKIEAGKARKALGGLWISGVNGDMKPEQHGGILRSALNNYTPGNAPALTDGKFGRY